MYSVFTEICKIQSKNLAIAIIPNTESKGRMDMRKEIFECT
jgi:hypothetical protein